MSVFTKPYDQFKIDKLKSYLEELEVKGQPNPYEIFVDSLRVVRKTTDTKDFDGYERFMDENTEMVRIIIYNSAASPRNDQYCFTIKKNNTQGDSGLGEIETIVQEKLAARDKEYEFKRLLDELEQAKEQLKEAEEYAYSLEKALELEKSGQQVKKMKIGELLSIALETMVRRNPVWVSKVPIVGETLAGIIEQDNQQAGHQLSDKPTVETTASFKKKMDVDTQEYEHFILLFQQLEKVFTEEDLRLLMLILHKLQEEPGSLKTIAELLNMPTG